MKRLRGFAMISAIFLLVVLTLLGAAMLTLSNTQHLSSAQDVQGVRAYHAARTGVEWAAARLYSGGTPLTACPAGSPYTLDDNDGDATADLEDFTVAVACAANTYDEAGTNRVIFKITATASAGGSEGGLAYIERQLVSFIEF